MDGCKKQMRDMRRKAMFWLGYSTQEVADAEGVTKQSMISWRECRGVVCNKANRGIER